MLLFCKNINFKVLLLGFYIQNYIKETISIFLHHFIYLIVPEEIVCGRLFQSCAFLRYLQLKPWKEQVIVLNQSVPESARLSTKVILFSDSIYD